MSFKRLLNTDDDGETDRGPRVQRRRLIVSESSRGRYSSLSENQASDLVSYSQTYSYPDSYLPAYDLNIGNEFDFLGQDNSIGAGYAPFPFISSIPYITDAEEDVELPMLDVETSTQEEQICYGTLFNEKVKLVGHGQELNKKVQELYRGVRGTIPTHTLRIQQSSEGQLFVEFSDGTNLGQLCEKVERGFKDFTNDLSIEFDAVMNLKNVIDAIHRVQKSADAVIRVNINIYGPESKCDEVGRDLSDKSLFLQEPNERREGTRYKNPHILLLEGMDDSETEEVVEAPNSNSEVSIPSSDRNEDFQETIAEVFSSLKRSDELRRLEGSESLNRALYQHQEEALDFMLQRETGDIPPEYRLWQPKTIDGVTRYCHAITRAQQQDLPDESGGGILADEMGMGKSLTTLVLVEMTLNNAHQWVEEQETQPENFLAKKRCRATLVVVPTQVLINTWVREIDEHLNRKLKILKYHGRGRRKRLGDIERFDIVITTYNTLAGEHGEKEGRVNSPLHNFEWYRVVLDEAHWIRRSATTFHRATKDLSAKCRWCLSGTPIQNNLLDLGALLAFIQVNPFHNLSSFRYWISTPFEDRSTRSKAIERLALLLEGICLRRTIERVNIPGRREETRPIEFTPEERKQYEDTRKAMQRFINEKVGEYKEHKTFGMFQVFLQLRSLCNHGTYQHQFSWTKRTLLDEEEDPVCSITRNSLTRCLGCRQPLSIISRERRPGKCRHVLCHECSPVSNNSSEEPHCPICKSLKAPSFPFGQNRVRGNDIKIDSPLPWQSTGFSSKMARLVSDVEKDLWSTKSIIFSCWTRTLDLIGKHLKNAKIAFARIDGSTPSSERQNTLDNFNGTNNIRILIMTTGTGAFGLNLQSVNRVFIVEPQWNPSVEAQAVARAIRLGQEQQVLVIRYRVKNSIEENMYGQQTQKLKISKMNFKNDFLSIRPDIPTASSENNLEQIAPESF